ncbi:MAG: hypothetical protein R6U43_02805 [Candidatus Krumholzibacteriales bacterium]
MRKAGGSVAVIILLSLLIIAGCGDGEKEKSGDREFKVPDSLLTDKDQFELVEDSYHPVKGGDIANEDILVHYPPTEMYEFLSGKIFGIAFNSYTEIEDKIGRPAEGRVTCIGASTMDEYKLLTRKDWWYYGTIKGDTIYFEPYNIMLKRYDRASKQNIAQIGFRQRFAQMALDRLSEGGIPTWLKESMASYYAGEGYVLKAQAAQWREEYFDFRVTADELNGYLEEAQDMALTRVSCYIAYQMFENLMELSSEDQVLNFVKKLGEGRSLDQASTEVFGFDYETLISKIDDYESVPPRDWKG